MTKQCFYMLLLSGVAGVLACQGYDFVFQPNAKRQGTHLRFTVQTPSLADVLFVVDNSSSMQSKQQVLANSFNSMLEILAPQDTSYRIGIVSTDGHGFISDCNASVQNPPVLSNVLTDPILGAKGNCTDLSVILNRPHDGALGRLIAAYDPQVFSLNHPIFSDLSAEALQAVSQMLPTNPNGLCNARCPAADSNCSNASGPCYVLDRDDIQTMACGYCQCSYPCNQTSSDTCFQTCAGPAAQAMVQAYFLSNINGLGTNGFGWEEGIKSALWAVGIDPGESNNTLALTPEYNLLNPNAPNSYVSLSNPNVSGSWLRDDAVLAVMFVTDEQDCSMPTDAMNVRNAYEGNAIPSPEPVGSICYQALQQPYFFDTGKMAQLLLQKKTNMPDRLVVGFIGGVAPNGPADNKTNLGTPTDCLLASEAVPSNQCSGWRGDVLNQADLWAQYTTLTSGSPLPYCDSMSGSRYVGFVNNFQRRAFESICRNDSFGYSSVLTQFARLATLACFDLQDIQPLGGNPNLINVSRQAVGATLPTLLPQTALSSQIQGWYYDATSNRVCLTGLNRIVGDQYDIFILQVDNVDYQVK